MTDRMLTHEMLLRKQIGELAKAGNPKAERVLRMLDKPGFVVLPLPKNMTIEQMAERIVEESPNA